MVSLRNLYTYWMLSFCCNSLACVVYTQGVSKERLARIMRTYVRNVFEFHRQKIYDVMAYDYTDWNRPPDSRRGAAVRDTAVQFLGDGQYVAPVVELARAHAHAAAAARGASRMRAVGTFLYAFGDSAAELPTSPGPKWYCHGHDLPYVFGAPLVDGTDPFASSYTRRDRQLSVIILRLWINFIKSG